MKLSLLLTLVLGGLMFVAGCTDAAKPPTLVQNTAVPAARPAAEKEHADDGHDAPRISLADAKKAYDGGNVVIVDVRDVNAYKQEHIKGALHIPIAQAAANEDKLPKNKKIIVYCSWREEHTSASWVAEMNKKGYDAVALIGGTQAWKDAGYPMETGR
jgi:rhodanese-related sulfurtransferase